MCTYDNLLRIRPEVSPTELLNIDQIKLKHKHVNASHFAHEIEFDIPCMSVASLFSIACFRT